ncbi:hypothetical protein F5Y03DRAFT_406465 [Xylaria venustula]|nr:hypothetical protein F5Y03DRAFT_406465 [Xylaria venustula]
MGLSTTLEYQKVEFTVNDIGLILKTLLLCAYFIRFTAPIQRVAFHAFVLVYFYGFRQGMIIGVKYRDVTMALSANALEHKKGKKFHFTTTLFFYPLLCLTHLVGVIGIHFNAFKAGYRSVDELLHRPNLEHVDYVPLEWRDEVLDDDIFPMSYTTFSRIFQHVLLVAGFRTMARIYAFRLGALVEYDGSLTQAVRNFVASHTPDMFENNYQTERVREDLTRKRFGPCAGGTANEPLFKVLRDLSMQSDPRAPTKASAEQKAIIEQRRDMTARKVELEQARASGQKAEIARAKASLDQRRRTLHKLALMDERKRYFAEANNFCATGRSTADLQERSRPSRRWSSSVDVGELMRLWTGEAGFGNRSESSPELVFDDGAEERTEKAVAWLLCYAATATMPEEKETSTSTSTCLLCDKSAGTFDRPFPCPQCCREGVDTPPTVSSPEEWYDHVGMHHGKANVPVVVATGKAAAARLDDIAAPARKPAKRMREEDTTSAEPFLPGISASDFSSGEEPVRKKARRGCHRDELMSVEQPETSEIVSLEHTLCDSRYFDLASDSGLGSPVSGGGWISPVSSADTVTTPGLESPVISGFESALPADNAALLDLADLDDGTWLGFENWNDDAGWQRAAETDKAGLETCGVRNLVAWEDFMVEI